MDLRKVRTKNNIIQAFISLREKKPLEKITVKELADLAFINKATFYQHYHDIYDLSNTLENETLESILADIPNVDFILTNPKEATQRMNHVIQVNSERFKTLFSGSRRSVLMEKVENGLKRKIYELHPEKKNDLASDILLTVMIQGCAHAFLEHVETEPDKTVEYIGEIVDTLYHSYPL